MKKDFHKFSTCVPKITQLIASELPLTELPLCTSQFAYVSLFHSHEHSVKSPLKLSHPPKIIQQIGTLFNSQTSFHYYEDYYHLGPHLVPFRLKEVYQDPSLLKTMCYILQCSAVTLKSFEWVKGGHIRSSHLNGKTDILMYLLMDFCRVSWVLHFRSKSVRDKPHLKMHKADTCPYSTVLLNLWCTHR